MDEAAIYSVIADGLPGTSVTGRPVRVPKGFGSESWKVATDAGELLVKVRRRAADAAKLRNQTAALRLARSGGVPVPELLYTGSSDELGGRPVMVLRYVPGVDAEEVVGDLDAADRNALFSDLGEAVGRLHGIGCAKFTDKIGTPEADLERWSDVVGKRARSAARRNRELGTLDAPEIEAILDRLERTADNVSDVVEPVLIHHDLHLANVLLRGGRFAALIDFEQAKAWDPMHDFVKLGMWIFDEWPGGLEPFVAAYRRRSGTLPRAEERLATCLALENFVGLAYWTETGQRHMFKAALALLRGWTDGSRPWWLGRLGAELG